MELQVGDKVKYSREFLRSIGEFTGTLPFAEGVVKSMEKFGGDGRYLVTVDWKVKNKQLPPAKVLSCNLIRSDRVQFESR